MEQDIIELQSTIQNSIQNDDESGLRNSLVMVYAQLEHLLQRIKEIKNEL